MLRTLATHTHTHTHTHIRTYTHTHTQHTHTHLRPDDPQHTADAQTLLGQLQGAGPGAKKSKKSKQKAFYLARRKDLPGVPSNGFPFEEVVLIQNGVSSFPLTEVLVSPEGCAYIYICICLYICIICIYICMYMYVCMYVCMYACMYACMYVCMYECMLD